jgi:hypothetical protein
VNDGVCCGLFSDGGLKLLGCISSGIAPEPGFFEQGGSAGDLIDEYLKCKTQCGTSVHRNAKTVPQRIFIKEVNYGISLS